MDFMLFLNLVVVIWLGLLLVAVLVGSVIGFTVWGYKLGYGLTTRRWWKTVLGEIAWTVSLAVYISSVLLFYNFMVNR